MTATTDESALLAAIIAEPADDNVRLVYADWLDENDQPERAEFIRLQVALAWPDSLPKCEKCEGTKRVTCPVCKGKGGWSTGPHAEDCRWCHGMGKSKCEGCNGDGTARNAMRLRVAELWTQSVWKQLSLDGVHVVHAEPAAPIMPPQRLTAVASRGFVGDLYFPRMSDVCELAIVACDSCGGTGTKYVYAPDNADYRQEACFDCSHGLAAGDWQFTKAALDLAREHPIQRVWVGDVVALQNLDDYGWENCEFRLGDDEPNLPKPLFDAIACLNLTFEHVRGRDGEYLRFHTEQDALDALAVATATALRKAAGITTGGVK